MNSTVSNVSSVVNDVVLQTLVVDVETAMRLSNLGRTYIYQLINNGTIASIKRGKRRLIQYASLKAFLTTQPTQGEWRVPPCNIA